MKKIEPQLKTGEAKQLYKTMAAITDSDETACFLRDLFTVEELDEAVRRFEVAQMLTDKKTFREITRKTKMSSTTIARINYWLHHGTGGYRIALKDTEK